MIRKKMFQIGMVCSGILLILFLGLRIQETQQECQAKAALPQRILMKESFVIGLRDNIQTATIAEHKVSIAATGKQKKQSFYDKGWTTKAVNIRTKPGTWSEVIQTVPMGTKIQYACHNKDWMRVKYQGKNAYIHKDYITGERLQAKNYKLPENTGFKSFMDYRTITCKSSRQYYLQQQASTGMYGIRMVSSRYCAAIGTGFNIKVGDCADVQLKNGTVIPIIVADVKADCDTDDTNRITFDGSVVEFVIDGKAIKDGIRYTGDVSSACEKWDSPVEKIKVYKGNET